MHPAAISSAGAAVRLGVTGGTYIGFPSTSVSVRCFFRSARLTSISLSSVGMSSRLRGGRTTTCKCRRTVTQAPFPRCVSFTLKKSFNLSQEMWYCAAVFVSGTDLLSIYYYSPTPTINHPNHRLHKPSETAQTRLTCQPRLRRSCVTYLIVTLSDTEMFFYLVVAVNMLSPFRRTLPIMSEHTWPLQHFSGRGATIVAGVAAGVWGQMCFIPAKIVQKKKKKKMKKRILWYLCMCELLSQQR